MPLTVPPPTQEKSSTLTPGGCPADDAAYERWRDGVLWRHADALVLRHWHTFDLLSLLPSWRFDDLLIAALDDHPLFGADSHALHLNYSHKRRYLAVALKRDPKRLARLAARILDQHR